MKENMYNKIYNLLEIAKRYDAIWFDIWGVLHSGGDVYDGVAELFYQISQEKEVRVISNSPRKKETITASLNNSGLILDKDQVFSSGEITRKILNESEKYLECSNLQVYHIERNRNPEITSGLEINLTDRLDEANLVLLSAYRNADEDDKEILEMMHNIHKLGKTTICANPDNYVLHLGKIRKCAGYYAKYLKNLGANVIYAGKPDHLIFDECFKSLNNSNFDKKKILMIGDTLYTDIEGANKYGIDSALVLTGNMEIKINEEMKKSSDLEDYNDKLNIANKICINEKYKPNYLINLL